MTPEAYCQQKAASSGSSFYYSFLFLPAERRRAITALYAFCETHLALHQWDASQSLRCGCLPKAHDFGLARACVRVKVFNFEFGKGCKIRTCIFFLTEDVLGQLRRSPLRSADRIEVQDHFSDGALIIRDYRRKPRHR